MTTLKLNVRGGGRQEVSTTQGFMCVVCIQLEESPVVIRGEEPLKGKNRPDMLAREGRI
ncbi:MAG: hypothetical protein H0U23_02960 [Blastocatellia bacterium]|nr:hypothetical protein [Blastocatellia bacterium]